MTSPEFLQELEKKNCCIISFLKLTINYELKEGDPENMTDKIPSTKNPKSKQPFIVLSLNLCIVLWECINK